MTGKVSDGGDAGTGDRVETDDLGRTRRRVRLAAGCLLLVGLAFVQAPGFQVADTKFDLVVDPAGFLSRALHLWDAEGAMGQLQNQAYGYLWPMGPFFAGLHGLGLPGWVVQRLWLGLVLCTAFLGAARLVRALGVRSDVAVLVAAAAYALSPRMVSTVGPISIEAWPSALAPWVLLPLVVGSVRGSARRAAVLSGLAVAMVGGVNAAATAAVLPLGVVWLLTRRRGVRRRTLLLWWPAATALGTLWWLVPLFVLGAYSPPFLDWIETSSITTFPTTPFDVLRGTTAWVPYLDTGWRGGQELLTSFGTQLNTGLVVLLGLAGIVVRGNPHRRFLVWSLVTGMVLVSLGHHGAVQGWFSGPLGRALDGVLAPLRNVHKFDPVVRVPMVVGLAWAVDVVVHRASRLELPWRGRTLRLPGHAPVVALALVGVLGSATPALAGHLTPVPPTLTTPSYWQDTVTWLDRQDRAATLLVPGSGFADYLWGSPRDEPVQYLGAEDWAVRNAVPLTTAGNIRMLDSIEARLQQGEGGPGLAQALRRAGIGHLVVRNDLRPRDDVPASVLVHQALEDSPGMYLQKSFGPEVGGGASLTRGGGRLLVDDGWTDRARAIEVFGVRDSHDVVSAGAATTVVGGPEDLVGLADAGLLPAGPTRLAVDSGRDPAPPGPWVLTDGFQRRERFFGRAHDSYSSVITSGDRSRSGNPTPDYLPRGAPRWFTQARLTGADAVAASTSRSDSNATGGARPGSMPFAALDGDPASAWTSAVEGPTATPWWNVRLEAPRALTQVSVTLGQDPAVAAGAPDTSRLRVVTDRGRSRVLELEPGETRVFDLDGAATRTVRVESAVAGSGRLSLAEVSWSGRRTSRPLVLPSTPTSWGDPEAILLRTLADARSGCVVVGDRVPCVQGREVDDEEPRGFDRTLTLSSARTYPARLTARPVAGPQLYAALQQGLLASSTGSSVAVPDPRASGIAAVDGDPGTSWTPSADDETPTLSLNWVGRRTVSGLRVAVAPDAPVRRPTSAVVRWPGGERRVALDRAGRATFDPVRTDRLSVTLSSQERAASIDTAGVGSALPVGVSEIALVGLPQSRIDLDRTVRRWPCGSGPTLRVGGLLRPTQLVASRADLYRLRPVSTAFCTGPEEVQLAAGRNDLTALPGDLAVADRLALGATAGAAAPRGAEVTGDGRTGRRLVPATGTRLLVERHNFNPGWEATQGGHRLQGVVVDGWQQGWVVDGGTGVVRTRYAPDGPYRLGLLAGGLAFLALLLVSALPRRRWPGHEAPPLAGGGTGVWASILLALALGGLLGGWPGVLVSAVGAAIGRGLPRRHETGPWVAGLPALAASAAYAVRPWGDPAGWAGSWAWPGYLVLLALGVVIVLAAEPSKRWRARMAGSSTRRWSSSARGSDSARVSPRIWSRCPPKRG